MLQLERTLYRSVLRLCRDLDVPRLRGTLTANPGSFFDRRRGRVVEVDGPTRDADDAARRADDAIDGLVRAANGGAEFFAPGRGASRRPGTRDSARGVRSATRERQERGGCDGLRSPVVWVDRASESR